MNDRSGFESLLVTAFAAYADRAPTEVDPISMTAAVARGPLPRSWPRFNSQVSWLIIGAVLALLAAGAALVAGAFYVRPPVTDRPAVSLAELQSNWTSIGTRPWQFQNGDHFLPVTSQVVMVINPAGITYELTNSDLSSTASLSDTGTLVVTLRSAFAECAGGDTGTYAIRLSSDGQEMTLALVSDDCPLRSRILGGRWTRTEIGATRCATRCVASLPPLGTSSQLSDEVPSGWQELRESERR